MSGQASGAMEKKYLAHHFADMKQQSDSGKLGMWIFLGQEILFFAGLFMAYFAMRWFYPDTFLEAHFLLDWKLGAVNTVVLLTSSLTMALAVRAVQLDDKKSAVLNLWATIALACVFMVVKYFEYSSKIEAGLLPGHLYSGPEMAGGAHIFFALYFIMTGMHGLHVVIGIGLLLWMVLGTSSGKFNSVNYVTVENVGLYWHLVDLVWIFVFPLLYLVR